jgi:hypothetical protein
MSDGAIVVSIEGQCSDLNYVTYDSGRVRPINKMQGDGLIQASRRDSSKAAYVLEP